MYGRKEGKEEGGKGGGEYGGDFGRAIYVGIDLPRHCGKVHTLNCKPQGRAGQSFSWPCKVAWHIQTPTYVPYTHTFLVHMLLLAPLRTGHTYILIYMFLYYAQYKYAIGTARFKAWRCSGKKRKLDHAWIYKLLWSCESYSGPIAIICFTFSLLFFLYTFIRLGK